VIHDPDSNAQANYTGDNEPVILRKSLVRGRANALRLVVVVGHDGEG
jgi:hypothetical protein